MEKWWGLRFALKEGNDQKPDTHRSENYYRWALQEKQGAVHFYGIAYMNMRYAGVELVKTEG